MDDVAVLIPSCDKYRDLWTPFFTLFWKFWPDCNYNVYLGSNHVQYNNHMVKMINVGDDISWSDGLIAMLGMIPEEYVIMMLEDFFLRERVDNAKIAMYIRILKKLKGGLLRLAPMPGPDIIIKESKLGIISKEASYRVSTQGAVWRKDVLSALLEKGESAWEFELNGTKRSRHLECNFYGTTTHILTYKNHVVERGKWLPKEARRFRMMNIGCDFNKRKIMTRMQYLVWNFDRMLSKHLNKIPQSVKKTVRATAYKIVNNL
jgi:hypothetical protein